MNYTAGRWRIIAFIFVCILCTEWFCAELDAADVHKEFKMNFQQENQHRFGFADSGDEGNEIAGRITAWLLVISCFPIAVSILIRWINRFSSIDPGVKKALVKLNRFQKKHLMRFHYYLNPLIAGVALWHWLTSICKSTVLPEWGLLIMILLISFGIFLKYEIGPKFFRKIVYQMHTQPFMFVAMVLMLTIGHMIAD